MSFYNYARGVVVEGAVAAKIAGYIALGDSMSIDIYPHRDLVRRLPDVGDLVGAASLLFRNNDLAWPHFKSKGLSYEYPEVKFVNLCEDGATTFDFLEVSDSPLIAGLKGEPVLVTVTLGGNDLLSLLLDQKPKAEAESDVRDLMKRFDLVVRRFEENFPRAMFLLNTVYDPSDGSGELPGLPPFKEQLELLDLFNVWMRRYAANSGAMLADVHQHFLGHGVSAPLENRWYWDENMIEPAASGASEIRRLWLQQLSDNGLFAPCCSMYK